ncbi:MAG: rhodanese-like domain-containing protein, partial [Nanoarchaeota archaeon]
FREFPEAVEKLDKEKMKDKKIVTYCTGGIRCEKASAYLKQQGFENVHQLKEGVIKFGKQFPNNVWEGKLFVFDKRLLSGVNDETQDLKCDVCGKNCDLYRNCRNVYCDNLFISCLDCEKKLNGCCSESCFKEFKKQCMEKSLRKQNRREVNVVEIKPEGMENVRKQENILR